jgi:hypothetical protein
MYGLPEDFDASVFVGRELQQVSFTANTISLVFDGDVAIAVESTIVLQLGSVAAPERQTPPVTSSRLMALAGLTVQSARSDRDGTLALDFGGGRSLTLLDDSSQYESYQIQMPGRQIVV